MANLRSASTLVLTNSDLLHCIFTFVPAPLLGRLTRGDSHLARCATLLAPPDAKCVGYSDSWDKVWVYLLEIIPTRLYDNPMIWDRFLWHTARVRDIAVCTHDSQEINAAQLVLIQTVLMQNGGKTVLPLLHSMQWTRRVPTDGSLIPFFTSTLRCATFSLAGQTDDMAHALLLRRLRESSPYLEKIVINTIVWDGENLDVGSRLVRELLCFDRLLDIQIHRISGPATFLDLVAKPNLTSLSILDVPGPWNAPSSPIFVHDLRKLSVTGTGPALVGLFNLVRFQVLESATIDIEPSLDAAAEIEDILKAFYDAAPSGSLRSLILYISGSQTGSTPINLRDLVRPILPLREIHSFKFYSEEFSPRMEDTDVEALVRAWPKLEYLSLDDLSPSPDTSALSIHALYHIHAHCQNLKELVAHNIRCPAVGVHLIPAPLDRSTPHPLRRLWVNGQCIHPEYGKGGFADEHAEAFARYLLELFPVLDTEQYKRWFCFSPESGRVSSSGYRWEEGPCAHLRHRFRA